MRVVWWGTYDTTMAPRTRILMEGLAAAGVDIIEIHAPIWDDVRHKALMRGSATLRRLVRLVLSYPRLLSQYIAAPDHDAVITGCLGHIDILLLWPFARLRNKPIIWDAFISLYNTVVEDRQLVKPSHPLATAIKLTEALAARSVSRILLDTAAHASYFSETYGLPDNRVGSVFVGAEKIFFVQQQASKSRTPRERPQILFYGKFIPLHGLDVIVDAAVSEQGRRYVWKIVGAGQEAARIDERLESLALPHIERVSWIPYEDLAAAIADADVCLGTFGDSAKSGMVIPNKVFQILAAGGRLVTRDSPAIRELIDRDIGQIAAVTPGDPSALLQGIERVLAAPRDELAYADLLETISPDAIGRRLKADIEGLIAKRRGIQPDKLAGEKK
jgi:glycosyltransferase involved in cell wall biosynthesis